MQTTLEAWREKRVEKSGAGCQPARSSAILLSCATCA